MHGALLDELGISRELAVRAEPAPTNLAYTSYLLATVRGGSYAEGVGVALPCFWIYAEAGRELPRLGSPDSRYRRWIATHGAMSTARSRRPCWRSRTGFLPAFPPLAHPGDQALPDHEPVRVDAGGR